MHQQRNHPRNVASRRRKAQILQAQPVSMADVCKQVEGIIKKHNGDSYYAVRVEVKHTHAVEISHEWRVYVHNWGGHYGPTAADALQALRKHLEGTPAAQLPADVTLDF